MEKVLHCWDTISCDRELPFPTQVFRFDVVVNLLLNSWRDMHQVLLMQCNFTLLNLKPLVALDSNFQRTWLKPHNFLDWLPVRISMVLGTKHRQQQAEEQHHKTQTNHNYNWERRFNISSIWLQCGHVWKTTKWIKGLQNWRTTRTTLVCSRHLVGKMELKFNSAIVAVEWKGPKV